MNFKLGYTLNGKKYTIDSSDNNIKIDFTENNGHIEVKICSKEIAIIDFAKIEYDYEYSKENRIFNNGYQSWTDTKENSINDDFYKSTILTKIKGNPMGFKSYGDMLFTKYEKNVLFGYDISYIKGENEKLIISKNYKNAYLVIYHRVKENKLVLESDVKNLHLNGSFTIFDYFIFDEISEVLINKYLGIKKDIPKILGYTSWYNHYQNINEELINGAIDSIDKRFNLFQIDDGFETYVGDWFSIDGNKFPNGLINIVERIHEKGIKAGIWLAPFAVEKKSKLYKKHPEWLLKRNNKPFKCGMNWSGFYSLDIYNKEAREYIKNVLRSYIEMGFDFFKLDFLYAASCIIPEDKTRAMVNTDAYNLLREILADKTILGCGAIISSSYNVFDYLRIGPDVSLIFDDKKYMRKLHRERISTKITLKNTISRSIFNTRTFGNDPDVFLLRDDNISLSKEQKEALLFINSLFGSVLMTSDNINEYDEEKKELLKKALDYRQNAKVLNYTFNDDSIIINIEFNKNSMTYLYDIEKGELKLNG